MAQGEAGGGGGLGWPLTEFTVAEKLAEFRYGRMVPGGKVWRL